MPQPPTKRGLRRLSVDESTQIGRKVAAEEMATESEFKKGLRSGMQGLESAVSGVRSIGNAMVGDDEAAVRHAEQAQRRSENAGVLGPTVKELGQIEDARSARSYVEGKLGEALPSLLSTLAGSVVGAAAAGPGGAVTGAVAGATRGIGTKLALKSLEKIGANYTKKRIKRGAMAGGFATATGMEAGNMQQDILDPANRAAWESVQRQDRVQDARNGVSGVVTRHIDGDSFEFQPEDGSTPYQIRLPHINTADTGQEGKDEAALGLRRLTEGQRLSTLATGRTDNYGRKVDRAYVPDSDLSLSEQMLQRGAATVHPRYEGQENLYRLEKEGRETEGALPNYASRYAKTPLTPEQVAARDKRGDIPDPAVSALGRPLSLREQSLTNLVAGGMSGALEFILPWRILNKLGVGKEAAQFFGTDKTLKKVMMDTAKRVGKEAAKGMPTEGVTEGLQQTLQRTAAKFIDTNKEILGEEGAEEIRNAVAAGAVGGLWGGVGGIRAPKDTELAQAEADLDKRIEEIELEDRPTAEGIDAAALQTEEIEMTLPQGYDQDAPFPFDEKGDYSLEDVADAVGDDTVDEITLDDYTTSAGLVGGLYDPAVDEFNTQQKAANRNFGNTVVMNTEANQAIGGKPIPEGELPRAQKVANAANRAWARKNPERGLVPKEQKAARNELERIAAAYEANGTVPSELLDTPLGRRLDPDDIGDSTESALARLDELDAQNKPYKVVSMYERTVAEAESKYPADIDKQKEYIDSTASQLYADKNGDTLRLKLDNLNEQVRNTFIDSDQISSELYGPDIAADKKANLETAHEQVQHRVNSLKLQIRKAEEQLAKKRDNSSLWNEQAPSGYLELFDTVEGPPLPETEFSLRNDLGNITRDIFTADYKPDEDQVIIENNGKKKTVNLRRLVANVNKQVNEADKAMGVDTGKSSRPLAQKVGDQLMLGVEMLAENGVLQLPKVLYGAPAQQVTGRGKPAHRTNSKAAEAARQDLVNMLGEKTIVYDNGKGLKLTVGQAVDAMRPGYGTKKRSGAETFAPGDMEQLTGKESGELQGEKLKPVFKDKAGFAGVREDRGEIRKSAMDAEPTPKELKAAAFNRAKRLGAAIKQATADRTEATALRMAEKYLGASVVKQFADLPKGTQRIKAMGLLRQASTKAWAETKKTYKRVQQERDAPGEVKVAEGRRKVQEKLAAQKAPTKAAVEQAKEDAVAASFEQEGAGAVVSTTKKRVEGTLGLKKPAKKQGVLSTPNLSLTKRIDMRLQGVFSELEAEAERDIAQPTVEPTTPDAISQRLFNSLTAERAYASDQINNILTKRGRLREPLKVSMLDDSGRRRIEALRTEITEAEKGLVDLKAMFPGIANTSKARKAKPLRESIPKTVNAAFQKEVDSRTLPSLRSWLIQKTRKLKDWEQIPAMRRSEAMGFLSKEIEVLKSKIRSFEKYARSTLTVPAMTTDEMIAKGDPKNFKQENAVLKTWAAALGLGKDVRMVSTKDLKAMYARSPDPAGFRRRVVSGQQNGAIQFDGKDVYIFVHPGIKSESSRMSVMAHELGHAVFRYEYRNADTATRDAIKNSYNKWRKENEGKTVNEINISKKAMGVVLDRYANGTDARQVEDLSADQAQYLLDFEEYFADQVSRWLTTADKPRTVVEKFFNKIAEAVKALYALATGGGYTAEPNVSKFMESLYTNLDTDPVLGLFNSFNLGVVDSTADALLHPGVSTHNAAIRASLYEFLKKDELKALDQVFSSRLMRSKVRGLLMKDNRKSAAAEMMRNPEAAISYGYEYWANGQLKLGPRTIGTFNSMVNAASKKMGVVRTETRAEEVLMAYREGLVLDRANTNTDTFAISPPQFTDTRLQQATKMARDIATPLGNAISMGTFTATGQMQRTGNGWLRRIASVFAVDVGTEGEKEGFHAARGRWQAKFSTDVLNIFEEHADDPEFGDKFVTAMNTGKFSTDPDIKAAQEEVKAFFKGIRRDYLVPAGVNIGDRANESEVGYWPQVYDREYLADNMDEFANLIEKYASDEFLSGYLQFNPRTGKKEIIEGEGNLTPEQRKASAQKLAEAVFTDKGSGDGQLSGAKAGHRPFMSSFDLRALDFIPQDELAPFLSMNPGDTLHTYVEQAVKRAEFTRRFGRDGERLSNWLDRAKKAGATQNQLRMANKYVSAQLGTLGADKIKPTARQAMGAMMVFQNVRVLSMALFSSLVDPLGILARSGDIQLSLSAFKEGIKSIIATTRDEKTAMMDLAESIGAIEDNSVNEALNWEYGGIFLGGTAARINRGLFKWTGLNDWTRATRVMATAAGKDFLIKHATRPNKHSARFLDQLGVSAKQIKAAVDPDGNLTTDDPGVQIALNRFVDESILRPNASQRPIWGSDPRFMLVMHLKQFTYSFYNIILKRMYTEAADYGNIAPAMTMLAYVPGMILADLLRDGLKDVGDDYDDDRKDSWTIGDYAWEGVQRAGLLGVGQFAYDAQEAAEMGKPMLLPFAGPTAEWAHSIYRAAKTDNWEHWASKQFPGQNLVNPVMDSFE